MKEMMIFLGRKTLFLLRWVLRLCWKIVKWPVYVVVFFVALYQLMLLPFRFVDAVYVFGDERAIHKKNFNYVIKEAAKKDQFIHDTIQGVPEGQYLEQLMKVVPYCCYVELYQIAVYPGISEEYDIANNIRKIDVTNDKFYTGVKMTVFIDSYFGVQDYIYKINPTPSVVGKEHRSYWLYCNGKGACWED